jgi:importin subunit alpha-6/7
MTIMERSSKVPEWRKNAYKNRGQPEDVRRRREEASVELRKSKKEESLAKRRNFNSVAASADSDEEIDTFSKPTSNVLTLNSNYFKSLQEMLPAMVAGVFSDNVEEQLNATVKFRRLLSKEHNPPIAQVIETGVIPRFVEFLGNSCCLNS